MGSRQERQIEHKTQWFPPQFLVWSISWCRISEKAMAPHSSTLAWKIPWTEEPGRLQAMGSLSWTQLSNFTFTFHFHALEKEMATHSSVLAWRIPGTGEPGALPSMGSHRVRHDWSNLAAAAAHISSEWSSLVSGPEAKFSSLEITNLTPFTVSYQKLGILTTGPPRKFSLSDFFEVVFLPLHSHCLKYSKNTWWWKKKASLQAEKTFHWTDEIEI